MASDESRQGVQSLEKGIGVLLALTNAKEPLRLSEVADAVGMSRSKAHAYLASLVRTGMATQDAHSARYALGESALRMGMAALRKLDLFSVAREALLRLQRQTGETAFLTTWTSQGPMIVDKVDAAVESAYTLQMGITLNLMTSASGLVFMAFLPTERWEYMLPTETDRTALEAALAEVRAQRMAVLDPSTLPGHTVLAAPVFDRAGTISAALCIAGPIGRLDKSLAGQAAVELREAAARVSQLMGHI